MKRKKIQFGQFIQSGRNVFFMSSKSKVPYVVSVYKFSNTSLTLVTSTVHDNNYKVLSITDYVYIDTDLYSY